MESQQSSLPDKEHVISHHPLAVEVNPSKIIHVEWLDWAFQNFLSPVPCLIQRKISDDISCDDMKKGRFSNIRSARCRAFVPART